MTEEQFAQAADEWDIERLYQDLSGAKRKAAPHKIPGLTDVEKCHLRGLLCEYSPAEIAQKLQKSRRGVEVDLCNSLYRYTEQLTNRQPNTLQHWSDVINWLEAAGYKLPQPTQTDIDRLVQQLRQHCHDKIQTLYGKMQLLDISQPVDIDNFYVEVNILEKITSWQRLDISDLLQGFNPDTEGFDDLVLGRVHQERVLGIEVVKDYNKLMVLGKPGSGKTTFLQYLAIQCNRGSFEDGKVPIFIQIKKLVLQVINDCNFRLSDYIKQQFKGVQCLNKDAIDIILNQGRAMILMDGLDEAVEDYRPIILEKILQLSEDYFKNKFILSCRSAASRYQLAGFTYVEIADFNFNQIRSFAQKWFVAVAKNKQEEGLIQASRFLRRLKRPENQRIRELSVTPILLHLICLVFQVKGAFPSNRAKLYEQGLDILLRNWDDARDIQRDKACPFLTLPRKKKLLSKLAAITFEQGDYFFEKYKIQQYIAEYLGTLSDANYDPDQLQLYSEAVLRGIEAQNGLLRERTREIYSFSHITFHDYLTAREIFSDSESQALARIIIHVTEPRWREIFLLAAGMLNPADNLLRLMKHKIDELVASDDRSQQFLTWLYQKSSSFSPYKAIAIRAFYLVRDQAFSRSRSVYGLDFVFTRTDALYLDHSLTSALRSAHRIDFALNSDLDLTLSYASALAIALEYAIGYILDPELAQAKQALQQLKTQLPNIEQNEGEFQAWWRANGQTWTNKLRTIMIKYCNIGHDWQFSQEQKQLLKQYYDANQLLVDCLNSASNVTPTVRQEIEDTLLLPIAEIQKKK